MAYKIIQEPETEPVSLDEAKIQCKVDHDADNVLLAIFIKSAREKAEHLTGRAFITQTLEFTLNSFPASEIILPVSAVQEVLSIEYISTTGDEVTLPTQLYSLNDYGIKHSVKLAFGAQWPETQLESNVVKIKFVAGYGDADVVPGAIKSWMLLTIESLYRNRGAVTSEQNYEIPNRFYDSLLDSFRIWSI